MAEQKVNLDGDTVKLFQNIQFPECDDKYNVDIQCNTKAETLWIKFTNKRNTKTFEQTFNKENMEAITSECKLAANQLYEVTIDQLSSNEFIQKCCRLFVFADVEEAIQKRDEFKKLRDIPNNVGEIKELEGKPDLHHSNILISNRKSCALFLLHFSPSKYVKCNYCFVLQEKALKDTDRFMIKCNELKHENETLQNELTATKSTVNNLSQQMQELTVKLQQLENRLDAEHIVEAIDLNLINNWQTYANGFASPKAFKSGKIIYLQGLIKGGKEQTSCAVLPQGWRPDTRRMFCTSQNTTAGRIDVSANGYIVMVGGYITGHIPLDGILFHTH